MARQGLSGHGVVCLGLVGRAGLGEIKVLDVVVRIGFGDLPAEEIPSGVGIAGQVVARIPDGLDDAAAGGKALDADGLHGPGGQGVSAVNGLGVLYPELQETIGNLHLEGAVDLVVRDGVRQLRGEVVAEGLWCKGE